MSEHQLYHEVMNAAGWAHPSAEICRCKGGGWVLGETDIWYKCPFHEGRHPEESYEEELTDEELAQIEADMELYELERATEYAAYELEAKIARENGKILF